MYTNNLQQHLQNLSQYTDIDQESVSLLEETMACFIGVLGRRLDARVFPQADLLQLTIRLLLISEGLARSQSDSQLDGIHYLVAMGFEQSGALLSRFFAENQIAENENPLENDHWYRSLLAFLHYLAGGYRVQALGVLRQLEKIARSLTADFNLYLTDYQGLERFYRGSTQANPIGQLEQWLSTNEETEDRQGQHISLLAQKIRQRRDIALSNLGRDKEREWLTTRFLPLQTADFWIRYLNRLEERGITTFTNEQSGVENHFEWLRAYNDLLVILPTGSGKTIIGELRTALGLANNKQVVWLLPTRALVRQTTKIMRAAFEPLQVTVEELPTTEDPIPLFDDTLSGQQHIAITTPERYSALVRANPDAIMRVGLVVVDEAQILLDAKRGTTIEVALQKTRQLLPDCNFVLMTAFNELENSLEAFLTALRADKPTKLVSDNRLTRRIYGILTNYQSKNNEPSHPIMLLFPPKPQEPQGNTTHPYWLLSKEKLTSNTGATEIAERFTRDLACSNLRSVIFVRTVKSTETQAQRIAKKQSQELILPSKDVIRLEIELGRTSIIMETGKKGVVPHHGGLTKLEQIVAEKWVQNDVVQTVVATPTLASGVNLPFDFSIVTYTHRQGEPLTSREIMNMIGRAGRAGYVSDGIGLIARQNLGSPRMTLDDSRSYFFQQIAPNQDKLGLARLLLDCVKVHIGNPEYPFELGGLDFSQVQTLQSFVIDVIRNGNFTEEEIDSQIRSYPSAKGLAEQEIKNAVNALKVFGDSLKNLFSENDSLLPEIMQRTGLPIEVLQMFLKEFQTIDLNNMAVRGESGQMAWADELVRKALESCSNRAWYSSLFGHGFDLGKMFLMISSWRAGNPISYLENIWNSGEREKQTRIQVGQFINHKLSLYTQFWGALAVCYESIHNVQQDNFGKLLQALPAFTREGVSSTLQLHWLYALGRLDRVLAHEIAQVWEIIERPQESIPYLRSQLRRWYLDREPWPLPLAENHTIALKAVISEL